MSSLTRDEIRQSAAYATLFLVLVLMVIAHVRYFGEGDQNQDIYFSFVEGQRILAGENPYERVLSGNFRSNDKYATYFPLFYELSAMSQWSGLGEYGSWLAFWRVVFAAFDIGIALLLFETCRRRGAWLLGVFAAAFWGLSRWSLFVVLIGHLDFLPIFFLLWSLLWLRERPTAAFVLYGVSLSLKQIGIFLAPLYLIWAWQMSASPSLRDVVRAGLWIALVPLIASAPFLAWNATGFLGSVLFSATRHGTSHFGALSVDSVLGLVGPPGRLPMLALLGAIYGLAATRTIGVYTSCLLTFAVFIDFNTVFYTHYPTWAVPFVPTAALDGLTPGGRAR